MRPELPVVVEQTGEGQYLATIEGLPGLPFEIGPDGIPRVEAERLGIWVELSRPRDARTKAWELHRNGILNDFDICADSPRNAGGRGRPTRRTLLTRKGALKSWIAREERHVDSRLKRLPPMAPPFQPQLPERGT